MGHSWNLSGSRGIGGHGSIEWTTSATVSGSSPSRISDELWTLRLWDTSPIGQFAYCLVISPTEHFAYLSLCLRDILPYMENRCCKPEADISQAAEYDIYFACRRILLVIVILILHVSPTKSFKALAIFDIFTATVSGVYCTVHIQEMHCIKPCVCMCVCACVY